MGSAYLSDTETFELTAFFFDNDLQFLDSDLNFSGPHRRCRKLKTAKTLGLETPDKLLASPTR
jgi:hypothetical protein